MGYAERFIIAQADTRDPNLRECLRCLYMHGDRALRPDMPPDLILRDQEPPDLILKDEITGEMWELTFGVEIVVTPYPYSTWWRTGVWLNQTWNMRMRRGEIVVSEEPLPEPATPYYLLYQANFILEVVNEELVYTEKAPFSVVMRDLGAPGTWWKVEFRREISVTLIGAGIPLDQGPLGEITGIRLNDGWEWQIWGREVRTTRTRSIGPYLWNERKEWLDLWVEDFQTRYRLRKNQYPGQMFFSVSWALYFRGEITVFPWPYPWPMNGLVLAPESPTWVMEMRREEIVMEENILPPAPYYHQKPDRWAFGLEMNEAGELVYTPYLEADPRQRGEMAA